MGRNDPCPCGSGKKYKRCCLGSGDVGQTRRIRRAAWSGAVVLVAAILGAVFGGREMAVLIAIAGLLAVAAYVFFADPPPPTSGGDPGAISFGR